MYTEKSFEKSFLTIVQLFEIEVVPSIKNKVLYSLYILKGFYTSLPKMLVTFRGECKIDFFLEMSNTKIPLTFFKEVFTDTLCVERYAGPRH